jgi:hypothetical protein
MLSRTIKFLLLAVVTCWAIGAAQYLHEKIEHAEHDDVAVATPSATGADARGTSRPDSHRHHDDHDDCPTCQMLAHMAADPVTPPPLICNTYVSLYTLRLNDWRTPVVEAHTFAPIRGPPQTEPPSA